MDLVNYVIILRKNYLWNCRHINKSKVVQPCLYSYRQRYLSSQWSKCCGQQQIVHNKFWPLWWRVSLSIRVQKTLYLTPKKVLFQSEAKIMTQRKQALSITFSQYDWFISQNGRSWLARAWRIQRCLDSYRQRQISQSRLQAIVVKKDYTVL